MATGNKRKRAAADAAPVTTAVDAPPEIQVELSEEVAVTTSSRKTGAGLYTNKQRVLILSSRGITARYRHLMEDLKKLIPHHKKDNKLDAKGDIHVVNEIAELKSCNQVLYLETKKNQDLYMYLGKTPLGPSVKFHVANVHTMDELKLTGNCMIGSRPLLNFDASFDSQPHLQLLKSKFCEVPRVLMKCKLTPRLTRCQLFSSLYIKVFLLMHSAAPEVTRSLSPSSTGLCRFSQSRTVYVSLYLKPKLFTRLIN